MRYLWPILLLFLCGASTPQWPDRYTIRHHQVEVTRQRRCSQQVWFGWRYRWISIIAKDIHTWKKVAVFTPDDIVWLGPNTFYCPHQAMIGRSGFDVFIVHSWRDLPDQQP